MAERKCEANLSSQTIDKGSTRFVYDFEGKKHDLGPKTPERNAVVEMTITCQGCSIVEQFRAEGGPPFGASNEAVRQAQAFLKEICGGWKAKVESERSMGFTISDTPPDSYLPR